MSMVVNTNVQALNSHRNMKVVSNRAASASEKLSSGMKINRAADDAAGLAISEKMRAQISGLERASANAQDGISLIQTAEGALQETTNMLKRMRTLMVQASNDTLSSTDRAKIKEEINHLIDEIDVISTRTEFNTKKLLDGSLAASAGGAGGVGSAGGLWLQVGANSGQGITVGISSMGIEALFGCTTAELKSALQLGSGVSGATITSYIDQIDAVIDTVNVQRAALGAVQNRLEHTINNLDVAVENLSASESRIRDADMAKEMMEFTQGNVLTQAATAMLAQANMSPQNVLQLLG